MDVCGWTKGHHDSSWDDISAAHVESFNNFLDIGLMQVVRGLKRYEMLLESGETLGVSITRLSIEKPSFPAVKGRVQTLDPLTPRECRERRTSYEGRLEAGIAIYFAGRCVINTDRVIGSIPVMVRSKICTLYGLSPDQLVKKFEEPTEFGGYFIMKGIEKIIRLLLVQRRNYPIALIRAKWKTRGDAFTEYGVVVRSILDDHTAKVMTLHFLSSGMAMLCLSIRGQQYFVPLVMVLKGLCDVSDKYIYESAIHGRNDDDLLKGCIRNMLSRTNEEGLLTQEDVLRYLGRNFRVSLYEPAWLSDVEIGKRFLESAVCIHLMNPTDKFNYLLYMNRKMFALVRGECAEDDPDNPQFQEVLLPGQLYQLLMMERLVRWQFRAAMEIVRFYKKKPEPPELPRCLYQAVKQLMNPLSRAFSYFLTTGNLSHVGNLALQQSSGFAIIADKLNYLRYLSHFRAIHRGAYFTTMRTTSVRKLRPEAWGFICPVHTPDGSPCGLLNHLSALCRVTCKSVRHVDAAANEGTITKALGPFGFVSASTSFLSRLWSQKLNYPVYLDGKILGDIPSAAAAQAIDRLRSLKVSLPPKTSSLFFAEIVLVPHTGRRTQYPGLFLFTHPGRMVRPVRNLQLQALEYIGVYEQVYMQICVEPEDADRLAGTCRTTHQELTPEAVLSFLGTLTPYSDHNQSPRNMYQCQMGKQTMGSPGYCLRYRADNKMYRLQTPQTPMVRTRGYDDYGIDAYPLGTNAIVAVIAYTGYDMEDAMVINKGSYERGFAHGQVYKTEVIDLTANSDTANRIFARNPKRDDTSEFLDVDGLPYQGLYLEDTTPFYSYLNQDSGTYSVVKFKHTEAAYVDHVKILGNDPGTVVAGGIRKAAIMLRIPRNPSIGDKFASRHGQKGICSYLWPAHNMPFTETGMVPDILFNPHGFPSRMTVGMLIESMAGKAGMAHGMRMDATPFTFSEDTPAVQHFGDLLAKAGYNYLGNEQMYSGIDGREFEVSIFFGVIYYQRLRHMVADKFQVRTTGAVDPLTHQPIHGRKRGGGVRLGEMERDSLLAHGTSMLLQDRLFHNSDHDVAWICKRCGDILSVSPLLPDQELMTDPNTGVVDSNIRFRCRLCGLRDEIKRVNIPFVLRYLANELASVGIRLKFNLKEIV